MMEEMRPHHQLRWQALGEPGAFGWPRYVDFHKALIADALPRGEVEVIRIRAGETPVGWLYNFLTETTAYYYLGGFVFEENSKLKPGLVCHAVAIEHHRRAGRGVYDFMGGDMRYKRNLGQNGPGIFAFAIQRKCAKLMLENVGRKLKRALHR